MLIFGEKMLMPAELKWWVTWFMHFLDFLWIRYKCAKRHHCRICKAYFKEGSLFGAPNPWAASKKRPSSIGLKVHNAFQTTLKFHFQILLQFYRTAKKITKIKLAMVIVKRFDKYYHLFNFHILVTILFFHDWDSSTLNIKVL